MRDLKQSAVNKRIFLSVKCKNQFCHCACNEGVWGSTSIAPFTRNSIIPSSHGRFNPVESVPVNHWVEDCVRVGPILDVSEKKKRLSLTKNPNVNSRVCTPQPIQYPSFSCSQSQREKKVGILEWHLIAHSICRCRLFCSIAENICCHLQTFCSRT